MRSRSASGSSHRAHQLPLTSCCLPFTDCRTGPNPRERPREAATGRTAGGLWKSSRYLVDHCCADPPKTESQRFVYGGGDLGVETGSFSFALRGNCDGPPLQCEGVKVYLDTCCLNRCHDDQRQERIWLESQAIEVILERIQNGQWERIGSEALDAEIANDPNSARRSDARKLMAGIGVVVRVGDPQVKRTAELIDSGFPPMDALHLACAECGGAEVFLTTDDKLLNQGRKQRGLLKVRVEDPHNWYREVLE